MSNIIVIEDLNLSKEYDRRYVVVDKTTGEILDDAQGYGYKTKKKAYSAYAYKNRDKSKDKEKQIRRNHILKWMKEHEDFVETMDILSFEILKGSWGKEAKFDSKFVKDMLKENNLETDFTPSELLKVYFSKWR